MSDIDNIQKIDVKILAAKGADIDPYDFVPVLQRWIQDHTVPGVLIDVADYSHMHQGPGVILVGHEANISIDYTGGEMGLLFRCKRPSQTSFHARVEFAVKQALNAAKLLEEDPAFSGRLSFDASRIVVTLNDRLHGSRDAGIAEAVKAALSKEYTVEELPGDPRERLSFRLSSAA
jgi:hypothetical protein